MCIRDRNKGVITAKKKGTCKITVTSIYNAKVKGTIKVTVSKKKQNATITLEKKDVYKRQKL